MIKALRKKHLQIWTAWALLLPVGIAAAYVAVPKTHADKTVHTLRSAALPVIVKVSDRKGYTVSLCANSTSSAWQLEWKNKTASVYPSSLIYLLHGSDTSIENAAVVGRVEAKGDFYFPLGKDFSLQYHFVLYDIIHHQLIDTINF